MVFPFDFGFIPRTLDEDGDPIDAIVLLDAPVYPGCIVLARLIGVIEAEQQDGGTFRATGRTGIGALRLSERQARPTVSSRLPFRPRTDDKGDRNGAATTRADEPRWHRVGTATMGSRHPERGLISLDGAQRTKALRGL